MLDPNDACGFTAIQCLKMHRGCLSFEGLERYSQYGDAQINDYVLKAYNSGMVISILSCFVG